MPGGIALWAMAPASHTRANRTTESQLLSLLRAMAEAEWQLQRYARKDKIVSVFNTSAAHVWSLNSGSCSCGACMWAGSGLCCNVNNCHYDLSGDMFRHIYGPSLLPHRPAKARLHWVNQWRYLPPNATKHKAQLLRWAIVYVPSACEGRPERCFIHVNYHGCTPKSWDQRRLWVLNIGLNEYAEANRIVVLYPQAGGNPDIGTGCWNWLPYNSGGFHDPNFDTKLGAQLSTVSAMVEDLSDALRDAVVVPNDQPCPSSNVQAQARSLVV